jgi:hypothetical protein
MFLRFSFQIKTSIFFANKVPHRVMQKGTNPELAKAGKRTDPHPDPV